MRPLFAGCGGRGGGGQIIVTAAGRGGRRRWRIVEVGGVEGRREARVGQGVGAAWPGVIGGEAVMVVGVVGVGLRALTQHVRVVGC